MNFQNQKFIYYPLLVFLLYFGAEKACLNTRLQKLTQPGPEYMFYEYKTELLDQMERVYKENQALSPEKRKKIFMVLGSSRLMFFSYERFARNFPDWEIFNFSAPVTAPAFYAYHLERTLERGVRPDYILMEADPYQYNEASGMFQRLNVANSFDARFIFSNFSKFKREEVSYFLARALFAGFRYPPWLDNIGKRKKIEEQMSRFRDIADEEILAQLNFTSQFDMLDSAQRANRGSIKSIYPRPNWFQSNFPVLGQIARKDFRRMYSGYRFSERQLAFTRQLLEQAKEAKISVTILRPQVSRPMDRLLREDKEVGPRLREWDLRFRKFLEPYGVAYLDLRNRDDFYCNTFVDATHMSLDCYHPMLVLVMRQFYKY